MKKFLLTLATVALVASPAAAFDLRSVFEPGSNHDANQTGAAQRNALAADKADDGVVNGSVRASDRNGNTGVGSNGHGNGSAGGRSN